MQRAGVRPHLFVKVLAAYSLILLFSGCARFQHVRQTSAAEEHTLSITPSPIVLHGPQQGVVLSISAENLAAEAFPLKWTVADESLGRIVTSSGLTAVYRRTAAPGDNIVIVQDLLGNTGELLIQQGGGSEDQLATLASDKPVPVDSVKLTIAMVSEPEPEPELELELEADPEPELELDADEVVQPEVDAEMELADEADAPVAADTEEPVAPVLPDVSPMRPVQYTLLVGDEISLQVFREPDLSGKYRIEPGGVIRHELFGSIEIAGLTVLQAEAHITQVLSQRYLVNPRVTVRVVSSQASEVLVMGEVRSPGARQIPFEGTTTLLEVIAAAGGFTDLASVNRVQVIRQEDGRQRRIRVRVARIMSGAEPDFEIRPNDVIMVPQTFF